ncbi:23S rRNA (adenine(2503)-C(2))-methyltransferase RlmN [Helicobacter pylori]
MKASIYDFTLKELSQLLKPSFRAKQLYLWLYAKYKTSFKDMQNNFSKDFIASLEQEFTLRTIEITHVRESVDGSKKYLFKSLRDNHTFEAVLLKMKDKKIDKETNAILEGEKYTVCVSCQIGCQVGCAFCFTQKGGFVRNLKASEIIQQALLIKEYNNLPIEKALNIVFMGMGEPLNNLDEVCKAIEIFNTGMQISPKRITISTSGVADKIPILAGKNLGVQLAISLHAVDDKTRSSLMPLNKKYNIECVLNEVRKWPLEQRKRVMFEYLLIKDLNDSLDCAKKLLKLLNGIKSKVNLILFNPHEGSKFERPSLESAKMFADFLNSKGLLCTIRESKALDIEAACGQLREKKLSQQI